MRIHLILIGLCLSACTRVAVTPPIRTVPLESVATTREGHVALRSSGGVHATWGAIATGSGGVSVGVHPDAELQLDGAFGYSENLDEDDVRTISPFAGAARIGLKHRLTPYLALTIGGGGGVGPWGTFLGGDVGGIVAYENPYAVPFFAARLQLATPISPQTEVYFENEVEHRLTASTVLYLQPSIGVRFPIPVSADPDGPRLSLTLATAWTTGVVFDHDGDPTHAFGGEAGFVVEL
jgi:hypothetical protein